MLLPRRGLGEERANGRKARGRGAGRVRGAGGVADAAGRAARAASRVTGESAAARTAGRQAAADGAAGAATGAADPGRGAAEASARLAVAQARARLAVLQSEAGDVYDDITAAEAELRLLAGRRVAAEKVLRHDAGRREAAERALAAHDEARPGAVALIATRFRAADEWRAARVPLAAAADEVERDLVLSKRAVREAKEAFAARVEVRSRSAARLRRLTAECAAVIEDIAELEAAAGLSDAG